MAQINWTADQEAAITQKGKNILVSAAAGSGKTAVLTERILRRLMKDGANIDEMLIVTFTNAAAAEMKEKISKKIRSYEATGDKELRHKRRQVNAVADADISTIDSFCINCVRSNAHELNISRDFGICDETMGDMIIDEAIERLFEKYYNSEDSEEFLRLTEKYCTQYSDAPLASLLKRIYKFIQDYEDPMAKLYEAFSLYNPDSDIFSHEWARDAVRKQYNEAKRLFDEFDMSLIDEVLSVIKNGDEISAQERVEAVKEAVESFIEVQKCVYALDINADKKQVWNALYEIRNALAAMKKPGVILLNAQEKKYDHLVSFKKTCDEAVKAMFTQISAALDNGFGTIAVDNESLEEQFGDICESVSLIKRMVTELSDSIRAAKLHRNTFTFQDIEHLTYELLSNEENEVASLYRAKYTDILIDEYQDTNALQDAIFKKISRNNENIFMVGDLKQSIYAFRGGDPTIFRDKGKRYGGYKEDASKHTDGIRIDLDMNFRSNSMVVDAINSLFGLVMTEGVGDVDYNKQGERLVCGRDADKAKLADEELKTRKKPELVEIPFISKRGTKEMDGTTVIGTTVIEARYIAKRIREMVDNKEEIFVDGKARPIEYRDITIIGSSIKSVAQVYNEEFAKADIPLALPVMGYYENYEIIVMISLLRVLVNRRLDIPLVTLMRSPIGGFSDDELADIGASDRRVPMYERLLRVCHTAKDNDGKSRHLRKKAAEFIAMLDRFESYKRYKSVAAIIYDIYTETHFFDFVGAMENGEMAQQNLTLLYEKAKQFSQGGGDGLYGFVKYIEKVSADGEREKGMSLVNEEQNVVRMMTIHGSKGLEFPIVFGISLGKDFRAIESEEGIVHREGGAGMRFRDHEEKSYSDFPIYTWVKDKIRQEARSEDMRKLYVLMTRARERLICTVAKRYDSIAKFNEKTEERQLLASDLLGYEKERDTQRSRGEAVTDIEEMADVKGFYEWILPSVIAQKEKYKEEALWEHTLLDAYDIDLLYGSDVIGVLESSYLFADMATLPSKTTVSKVKESEKESTFAMQYVMSLDAPKKADTETAVPASVMGTAYHQVMAYVEPRLNMSEGEAAAEIEKIAADGEIHAKIASQIKPELVSGFYKENVISEELISAYKAGRLHRETPFEIYISPDKYNKNFTYYADNDRILLQGTIDCWYEDALGNCTVIDYKTDKIGDRDKDEFKAAKAEEYRVQLDLYSEAINMLENKRVVRRYLYLFAIGEFVEVSAEEGNE